MNAETTITIPDHVMSRQVGDETVLLDLGSGTYYGLDPVGARIWQLIVEGQQLSGVVTALLGEYDAEQDQLQQDVVALLHDLASRGLVEMSS